jgi:hypothetical protein
MIPLEFDLLELDAGSLVEWHLLENAVLEVRLKYGADVEGRISGCDLEELAWMVHI